MSILKERVHSWWYYRTLLAAMEWQWTGTLALTGALGALLYTAAQLTIPWVIARIIDGAILHSNSRLLAPSIALLLGTALVSVLFLNVHTLSFSAVMERSLQKLRLYLLAHVQRLSMDFFDDTHSGKVASLLTDDARAVATLAHPIASELLLGTMQLTGILCVVYLQYGRTVLISLVLIPFYLLLPLLTARATRSAAKSLSESKADFTAALQEAVQSVRESKIFNTHGWSLERTGNASEKLFWRQMRLYKFTALGSFSYVLYWFTIGIVYWIGGRQVLDGRITVGKLIALTWYLGLLDVPTRRLLTATMQTQAWLGSADRLCSLLKQMPEEEPRRAVDFERSACQVRLHNISFRYSTREMLALDNVSFSVDAGMKVSIVGPSGAGKSTLANLLLRMYRPQEGWIQIGSHDIRDYSLASLRKNVCLLSQQPVLFSGTLRENIAVGRDGHTLQDLKSAAKAANAFDFIQLLPNGFDTEIGERGVKLSVGQKQRIAIARVVLTNPAVLIADEPTSGLDAESDEAVLNALTRLMTGRTSLVITHDLRTAIDADLILVLDQGRLVGCGHHKELAETCAAYARLYSLQFAAVNGTAASLQ